MLYGEGSKGVRMEHLLDYPDFAAAAADEENNYDAEIIRAMGSTETESEDPEDLTSDDESEDDNNGESRSPPNPSSVTERTGLSASFTIPAYTSGKVASYSRPFGTPNSLAKHLWRGCTIWLHDGPQITPWPPGPLSYGVLSPGYLQTSKHKAPAADGQISSPTSLSPKNGV
jgi:hypothetical protein